MNKADIHSLTVLRNLLKNPIIYAYANAQGGQINSSTCGEIYYQILQLNAQDNLLFNISMAVLQDINVFSKSCGTSSAQPAYLRDLGLIYFAAVDICQIIKENLGLDVTFGTAHESFYGNWANQQTLQNLVKFYKNYGAGSFAFYKAFTYQNNCFMPLEQVASVNLADLKEYAQEKQAVAQNIERFLQGKPYFDMLLYGDKGTGKSSTIHAMLNYYFDKKLRIVEITKNQITQVFDICQGLKDSPLYFMIFIDDLVMNEKEESFTILKAALEGSASGKFKNIMFAVTSNRRHIIEESFEERQNSVHLRDKMQQQLSLFDRFGLAVLFDSPDRRLYLKIITDILNELNFKYDYESLEREAERFATLKGGRSPRRARQFTDYYIANKV